VPQAELACGRVGDDGDGMAAQPVRPALRLLSGVSCLHGRQLLYLHGVGNRSSTRISGGARALGFHCASGPTRQSEPDLSCEAETSRARQRLLVGIPLVGNWSEMQPTGQRLDVLPVWVLTRVLSPPCPESSP
jgi:hypothetical protein